MKFKDVITGSSSVPLLKKKEKKANKQKQKQNKTKENKITETKTKSNICIKLLSNILKPVCLQGKSGKAIGFLYVLCH